MAAARTGRHPHAGSAGTGERCWPPAESVLSKPQSSPTVLLVLLSPSFPGAAFVTSEVSFSTKKRKAREVGRLGRGLGWVGRVAASEE